MIVSSPPETSVRNAPVPTTAGISRASATMAVWLPGPPTSVTKPRTKRRSRFEVSLGVRLWASTSTGEVRWAIPSRRRPSKCRSKRFSMSKMSLARSAR